MASRPLKNLARRPIHTKDLIHFLARFHQMPDQATALVCAAWIERHLERVLLSRMKPLKKREHAELFIGLAPLSTFSAKIKLASALNIIGPTALIDLEIIKDIRNQFAHSFHPITFRTRAVAAACRRLKTPEAVFTRVFTKKEQTQTKIDPAAANDPRVRFTTACGFICVALGGNSMRGPRPRKPAGRFSAALH